MNTLIYSLQIAYWKMQIISTGEARINNSCYDKNICLFHANGDWDCAWWIDDFNNGKADTGINLSNNLINRYFLVDLLVEINDIYHSYRNIVHLHSNAVDSLQLRCSDPLFMNTSMVIQLTTPTNITLTQTIASMEGKFVHTRKELIWSSMKV